MSSVEILRDSVALDKVTAEDWPARFRPTLAKLVTRTSSAVRTREHFGPAHPRAAPALLDRTAPADSAKARNAAPSISRSFRPRSDTPAEFDATRRNVQREYEITRACRDALKGVQRAWRRAGDRLFPGGLCAGNRRSRRRHALERSVATRRRMAGRAHGGRPHRHPATDGELAAQSATGLHPDRDVSADTIAKYLDRRINELSATPNGTLTPVGRDSLQRYRDRLLDAAARDGIQGVWIHADFCGDNIIVSESCVSVLDFTMAGGGTKYHDLAHLFLGIDAMRGKPWCQPRDTRSPPGRIARRVRARPRHQATSIHVGAVSTRPLPSGHVAGRRGIHRAAPDRTSAAALWRVAVERRGSWLRKLDPVNILVDSCSYNCQNAGDLAMLTVAVSRLRKLWPRAAINVITNAPDLVARHCGVVDTVPVRGRRLLLEDRLLGPLQHRLPREARTTVVDARTKAAAAPARPLQDLHRHEGCLRRARRPRRPHFSRRYRPGRPRRGQRRRYHYGRIPRSRARYPGNTGTREPPWRGNGALRTGARAHRRWRVTAARVADTRARETDRRPRITYRSAAPRVTRCRSAIRRRYRRRCD